jgi:hypothetical protein
VHQVGQIKKECIKLVITQNRIKVHGQQNLQFCIATQAKQTYKYKNIKIELYKNNAAIWFNKTCRMKQITPGYISIKINGNNPQSQKTKNIAIRYRINQELKFLYAKKQRLNVQLHSTHLECAALWTNIKKECIKLVITQKVIIYIIYIQYTLLLSADTVTLICSELVPGL